MNQQINLFQPIFRKERKILSFNTMGIVCLIFVVLFGTIHGYSVIQGQGLKKEVKSLKVQHAQRLAQLEMISRESDKIRSKDQTESEINRLENELKAERYILSVLDGKRLRQIKGFSSYFESFSRQIVNGLWLTGFDVAQGGMSVQIRGSSIEPEYVPKFLQGLSQESQLNGTEFSVLQMLREENNYNWVDFVLSAGEFEKQDMS